MGTDAPEASASGSELDPYTFEGFKRTAVDGTRSVYEKIGFPDAYRAGLEGAILADIRSKATNLDVLQAKVLDIGCGCSPLAVALIEHARVHDQRLVMIDSAEMLEQLPADAAATLLPGRFPSDHGDLLRDAAGTFDAILVYSVIQYVAAEADADDFLDAAVQLLAPGGQLLIGDIPNESMRARFLESAAGREVARRLGLSPEMRPGKMTDATILRIVDRYRTIGLHAFLIPQDPALPMANRREDILIVRP